VWWSSYKIHKRNWLYIKTKTKECRKRKRKTGGVFIEAQDIVLIIVALVVAAILVMVLRTFGWLIVFVIAAYIVYRLLKE
jgi:Flp pilus assembly protein TadB